MAMQSNLGIRIIWFLERGQKIGTPERTWNAAVVSNAAVQTLIDTDYQHSEDKNSSGNFSVSIEKYTTNSYATRES